MSGTPAASRAAPARLPGWVALAALGCTPPVAVPEPPEPALPGTETPTSPPPTSSPTPTPSGGDGPEGFVGAPCDRDADCDYPGGACLRDRDGFPRGTCSAACDASCADAEGFATTFCADADALPPAAGELGPGACLSRCNFALFPGTGCRPGYGCATTARPGAPDEETGVCRPGAEPDLSDCVADLAARGVPFETSLLADDHPDGLPELVCHVEDPVRLYSGHLGIDLTYDQGGGAESVVGACALAHAVADSIEDLAALDLPAPVTRLRHLGTYNCRVIAGTDELSRHAYGDAIDVAGFDFADGTQVTLVDDWEDGSTDDPGVARTEAGRFLADTAHRWHDDAVWTIVLTPDYNAAHDDHFHVDLTPGSDFLGLRGVGLLAPNPWPGE